MHVTNLVMFAVRKELFLVMYMIMIVTHLVITADIQDLQVIPTIIIAMKNVMFAAQQELYRILTHPTI